MHYSITYRNYPLIGLGTSLENKEEGEEGSARVGFDKME